VDISTTLGTHTKVDSAACQLSPVRTGGMNTTMFPCRCPSPLLRLLVEQVLMTKVMAVCTICSNNNHGEDTLTTNVVTGYGGYTLKAE
jgi:hypothetical protein